MCTEKKKFWMELRMKILSWKFVQNATHTHTHARKQRFILKNKTTIYIVNIFFFSSLFDHINQQIVAKFIYFFLNFFVVVKFEWVALMCLNTNVINIVGGQMALLSTLCANINIYRQIFSSTLYFNAFDQCEYANRVPRIERDVRKR